MSKIRNKLIATLAIFAMLFTSLSAVMFAGSNFAKAEGEDNSTEVQKVFQLQDGASAALLSKLNDEEDYVGLRWRTTINKAYYDSLNENGDLEFGTIIAPKSYGDLDFSQISENSSGDWCITGTDKYVSVIPNDVIHNQMNTFDANGNYEMYAAIRYEEFEESGVSIEEAFATELVAKAYVKITDGDNVTYEYSTADAVRSLRNSIVYDCIAGEYKEQPEIAAELKGFVGINEIKETSSEAKAYVFYNKGGNEEEFVELKGKEIIGAAINSTEVQATIDSETGTVTFGAINNYPGKNTAYLSVFTNDGEVYYKQINIATGISTAEEFVETFSLAKGDLTEATSFSELATFDGYYVLTNNIDFEGEAMPTETLTYFPKKGAAGAGTTRYSVVKNIGLTGTFNGNGYTIYNLSVPQGGLFGVVNGTVENVAFVNVDIPMDNGLFGNFANKGCSFNNIYVEYNGTKTPDKSFLAFYSDTSITFTNCYFVGDISIASRVTFDGENSYKEFGRDLTPYNSTAIVITKEALYSLSQNNNFFYGASAGSIIKPTSSLGTATTATPNGKIYSYPTITDLTDLYAADPKTSTKTVNLQRLLTSWDKTYFDIGLDGTIGWKNDFNSYKLLANETVVSGDLLLETSGDNFDLGLSVKNSAGNVIDSDLITYSVPEDNGVATVTGSTIKAVAPGNTTLTVKYNNVELFTVNVNVVRPIIDKTGDAPIILDKYGEKVTVIDEGNTILSASVEGGTAIVSSDNVVALSFEDEKTAANKEYIVLLETETNTLRYKALYYTSYISTPEEFVETFSLGKGDLLNATTYDELALFDGYYKLGQNLDFTNVSFTEKLTIKTFNYAVDSDPNNKVNYGLTGTFDGDGYTLSNFVAPDGGLFGVVTGTIKNVAFVNADVVGTKENGIIAYVVYKTAKINNIYLTYNGTANYNKHLLARWSSVYATITNSYFEGDLVQIGAPFYSVTDNYSAGPQKAESLYILVSKRMITSQSKWEARPIEGAIEGSTTEKPWTSSTPLDFYARAAGKIYRYVSVDEMSRIYQDLTDERSGYLKTLLRTYDTNYFTVDETTGVITWKNA